MRRVPSAAEALAWELLRGRKILGLKFRRQQVIRGFIVDFYCAERRLVLELDGEIHDSPEAKSADAERTRVLQTLGLRVVRLRNADVSAGALAALLSPSP